MSDIVERLRMQGMDTDMQDTAREAADEIEMLWDAVAGKNAEIERLRTALAQHGLKA